MQSVRSVILHIPHSSMHVPDEERRGILLLDDALERELLVQTDRYTDELFDLPAAKADRIVFPISRLVVDPERFRDDSEEVMAERGVGAVYTRTHDGRVMRLGHDREGMLQRWYDPHHATLQEWTQRALAVHGHALLIDCHSYPSTPLPHDLDQSPARPDSCVGTDPFHTPAWLAESTCSALASQGWTVEIDRPYAGTMVPAAHYRKDPRVQSVMIELNRRLYMDERSGAKLSAFDEVRSRLQEVLGWMVAEWEQRGNPAGSFQLTVEDNFHHMDEQEHYSAGTFETYEEALTEARRITERSVMENKFDSATQAMFGEDPWISPSPDRRRFSAHDYARVLCEIQPRDQASGENEHTDT